MIYALSRVEIELKLRIFDLCAVFVCCCSVDVCVSKE